jgi:hypothetical protein
MYTYDVNGQKLSELGLSWSNGQWVNSSNDMFSYDAQENVIAASRYIWVNSRWIPTDWPFALADSAGNNYFYSGYSITLIRKLIVTGVASPTGDVPVVCSLAQNYPNPFNPATTITYELPIASQVTLSVYDVLGREVSVLVNGRKNAGVHEVKFDGVNLPSGVYFYRLQAGDFCQSKKLVLLK